MKVRVYFNLHKKVWSVQTYKPGKGWRVDFHSNGRTLCLTDVTFHVSEAGRQRVLREKRKNVHAYAIGTLVGWLPSSFKLKAVSYNPYKAPTFMCEERPIHKATKAEFHANRTVWAEPA